MLKSKSRDLGGELRQLHRLSYNHNARSDFVHYESLVLTTLPKERLEKQATEVTWKLSEFLNTLRRSPGDI